MKNFVIPGDMQIADAFTRGDLNTLLTPEKGPCVSVYMPTHRSGKKTWQNVTRFKNALAEIQELFPETDTEPVKVLVEDTAFWQHQNEGFAMFISPDFLRIYRLPRAFPEVVVAAADQFHLTPVLPLVVYDMVFFILALSQNESRLFKCSTQICREIQPENLPESLAQALRFDLQEKQLQFHSVSPDPQKPGKKSVAFHGHGVNTDEDKTRILRYFQAIDNALTDFLGAGHVPLILAGVDYLHPLYKTANHYPHLLEDGIKGNMEEEKIQDLHAAGAKIVEPVVRKDLDRAVKQYHDMKGTGRTANDLEQIVKESTTGRISHLVFSEDDHAWGEFIPEQETVILHAEKQKQDQDLLNTAVCHALRNGASVFPVPNTKMPDQSPAAAVFRY